MAGGERRRTEDLEPVRVHRLHDGVRLPVAAGGGRAVAVAWPGNGARERAFHYLELHPGASTAVMTHAEAEAVYYVVRGSGRVVDHDAGDHTPVRAGQMFLADAGTAYEIRARDGEGLTLVGGPCPPDDALYAAPVADTEGGPD